MSGLRAIGQYVTVGGVEREVRYAKGDRVRLGPIEDPWQDGEFVNLGDCDRTYWLDVTARWRGGDVRIYMVRPTGVTILTHDAKVVEGLDQMLGNGKDGWMAPAPADELADIREHVYDERILARSADQSDQLEADDQTRKGDPA